MIMHINMYYSFIYIYMTVCESSDVHLTAQANIKSKGRGGVMY